jgi:hypothetical protein
LTNKWILLFYLHIPGIRPLQNEFQLLSIFDKGGENQTLLVQFHIAENAKELPSNIAYALQVPQLQTYSLQYLGAVRDSYFKPVGYALPYQKSGLLALKLAVDNVLFKMLQRDQFTDFNVSNHVDDAAVLFSLIMILFQISLTKFPQPAGPRPAKVQFKEVAFLLTMPFVAFVLFLVILPSIETKVTGFDGYLKKTTRFAFLNGIINYAVNLVQMLIVVFAMLAIFSRYEVFGCISIGYPVFLSILFSTAMMSLAFLLQAIFESSKLHNSSGRYSP